MKDVFKNVGRDYYPGSSVGNKLYQDFSFLGYKHKSHRQNTIERADHLASAVDFTEQRVLDLGCSNGALSIALAWRYNAVVTGVDLDPQSIDVARFVAEDSSIQNVSFHCHNLISDDFTELLDTSGFDVVLWLSQFMWLWRYEGWDASIDLLHRISTQVPVMLFETAQAPKDGAVGAEYTLDGLKGVMKLLQEETSYTSFKDIGYVPGWSRRNVVLARK